MTNEHIATMGYRLELSGELEPIQPLLVACGLRPVEGVDEQIWGQSHYLQAYTMAGGIAASVAWNRANGSVVLHSLAVAPTSRGSGIGASLLSTVMGLIMDEAAVEVFYLRTEGARRFFASFGFEVEEASALDEQHVQHPALFEPGVTMARRYAIKHRGLDQCAFRLVHNTTKDATLPPGSVFLFQQSGPVLESNFRGGAVLRGHLIGAFDGSALRFLWHHYTREGALKSGDGQIFVSSLADGRRELREKLAAGSNDDPGELLLREI
ncbi:MAG: GNAT family N-acetyltransferase [Bradymonadaceae bacterium]|nr:GNAT family N-acetyltransferase [Lujinxingiaceae bacterium]